MFLIQRVISSTLCLLATAAVLSLPTSSSAALVEDTFTSSRRSRSASFGSLLSQELSQLATRQITDGLLMEQQQQNNNNNNNNTIVLRNLQASTMNEDFNEFRELFRGAVISLPDFEASQTIIFADFNIKVTNVKCMDIVLGDLQINYAMESKQRLSFRLDMNDLDLVCTMSYQWDYSFLNGDGDGRIVLNDNYASTVLAFSSVDFDLFPPNASQTESCTAEISITDMDFSGSISDQVLNVFESIMRGFVEDTVSGKICEQMGSLGTTLLQDMIDRAATILEPYLQPLPAYETNATAAEALLVVPPEINLMNFQEEGEDQMWFYGALKQVDAALGVWLIDPNTPREGGKDLGVNIALRENVLDENRAFEIAIADLPFDFDPVLFEGHDSMTETTITLETVRVFGLDTFTEFAPFKSEGKYTLKNDLAWDFLEFELDCVIDIKPSTQNNSILAAQSDLSLHIVEKVTMKLGVDNINATLSLMLAMDQDAFGALRLGPLLHQDNLMPCFMSSVFQSEVTVLQATIGNIRQPSIEGFIDTGIDNLVTNAVNAAFLMYKSVIIKATPNIFQLSVKGAINDNFFLTFDEPCPEPAQIDGYIDFRELLASAETALALGAAGTQPYGGIASSLIGFLKTQIATLEDDGTLSANDMFIRPFTMDQSGEEGTFLLPGDVFSVTADDFNLEGLDVLFQGFKFSLSNISAHNLDTMVPPFKFLEPTTDPYALDNEIHFGPVNGRPLDVSGLLSMTFGDASPFAMNDEILFSMSSSAFEIFTDIIARVGAMALLNFPIADLLDFQCWLATIPAPALNELGLRVDPEDERGLKVTNFVNRFVDLNVNVECTRCTSTGLNLLPTVLDQLRATNVTSVLGSRMKYVVDDIVASDTFQMLLDRTLDSASKKCPHSASYTSDQASIGAGFVELPLPELSPVTLDTVQFGIATALQVGFVVFTQLFSNTTVNPEDPLERQRTFEIPEGSNLVNFTDFQLNVPSFLESAYGKVNDMINGTRLDPVTGQEDLSVNVMARDFFPDGVFSMESDGSFAFGPEELSIELHSIRIEGLDSFSKFMIGVPAAPQTLYNEIEMGKLAFELDFGLRSKGVSERIKVAFRFDDLSISVPLFAAIDKDLLKALQVGSLLRVTNILPCFLSTVYGFDIPQMIVNVGKIYKPSVEGLMPETDASLKSLVDTLFEQYGASMHESLPALFDNGIRPLLNSLFAYYVSGDGKGCPNSLLNAVESARRLMRISGSPFIDFRDMFLSEVESKLLGGRGDSRYGDLIRTGWDLIEREVLEINDATGLSPINTDIIAPMTESSSNSPGDLYFPGDLLDEDLDLSFGAIPTGIALRVSDARIENLDTIGNPFSLLDPARDRPTILNNTATIGVGRPLQFGVTLRMDITTEGTTMMNDFDITADLHTATVILTALLKVSEYRLAAFPIGDMFNLDCWLATLPPPLLNEYGVRPDGVEPTAAMDELLVTIKKLNLNITCRECSSPGLVELAELWSTPEATNDMTTAANDLLEYVSGVLGKGLVQTEIDRMLNDAARRCPHSPEYQKDFSSFTYQAFETSVGESEDVSLAILVMIVVACLVAILGFLVLLITFIVRRRHKRWLKTLPNEQLMLIKHRQEQEEEKEAELNATTQSMFASCDIPLSVRWVMPLIILGNIGFFLSGHLSLGAEVKIQIGVAGQILTIEQFYQFSMARSTVEIWQAGGKTLAILILLFSGIWPYTKQLITLALWFLPPTRCSISRRGSILLWLDTLAKWSIVDIFTLVVSIAAFRVSVKSPSIGFLPENLYSLDLLVVPMWGLWANLLAQVISQVSSHWIIHYHRNIVHQATKAYKHKHHLVAASTINLALTDGSETSSYSLDDDPYGDRKDLLSQHAYARPHRGEAGKLIARNYVNALVLFGAVVFAVLIVVGSVLPSTGLEFLGVLGVAVESGQAWQEAVTHLSVFDLAGVMMDQARFVGQAGGYIGLGFLSALLVITVLLVPLAQTVTLMYQWFVPMVGRRRKRLSIAIEVLQAWQYAEVYIISIIVATWQLGSLSTFMINSYCESFEETFNLLAYFGVLEENDAQCFRVDASIESAAYILAIAAALLNLLNTFVMNAVKQYFRDRDEVISRAELKERMFTQQEGGATTAMNPPEHRLSSKGELVSDEPEEGDESVERREQAIASDDWEGRDEAEAYIKPVPVLFSDKFRWLLRTANSTEALNGVAPHPPMGELTGKIPMTSAGSASDDEQPTSPAKSETKLTVVGDDPDESMVSSVYLEDR